MIVRRSEAKMAVLKPHKMLKIIQIDPVSG